MAGIPPLRNILNDTPASAIDVDWNFQAIEDYITTDVIKRDGSVAMEAPLQLLGPPPSAPTHAVPKSYVDGVIPVGVTVQFAGPVAPAGWALCDGSPKSQTDPNFVALFAVIGTAFNIGGEPAGQFRLPNLQGRVPVGRDPAVAAFDTLGEFGGNRDAVVPSHTHVASINLNSAGPNVDHVHGMSHGHTASAAAAPAHNHLAAAAIDTFFAHGRDAGVGHNAVPPPTGNTFADLHNLVTGDGGAHNHAVTVDAMAGNTLGANVAHVHNVSGAVTVVAAGVSAVGANLMPYLVLNHIIRVG